VTGGAGMRDFLSGIAIGIALIVTPVALMVARYRHDAARVT
jgi:hypothetical protein